MSLANNFNKRAARLDKLGREINTFEDLRSARIRQPDASYATFRGGLLIGKEDAPSRFHILTPVSTIVAEEPVEKEAAARVRKQFDVNAKALKL